MEQIIWNKLGLNGESKQHSFEDLCMFLCCRELKISKIEAYKNQPGIESEPFIVNGKNVGFQAKFFDAGFDWKQIKKSILGEKTDETTEDLDLLYPKNIFKLYALNSIYIYTNEDKTYDGRKSGDIKTETEKLIDKFALKHKCKINYIGDKGILGLLSQPSNFDLAKLYFGVGDEFGFIKNSVDSKLLTFIKSNEYIELPLIDNTKSRIQNISQKILSEHQNIFLLLGNPGSGKSLLMHKLLQLFGGLDKKKNEEMVSVLTSNNAVPILVNLKNCQSDSLENIIRGRINDFSVKKTNQNFIFLFDGLDELNEKIADNVLLFINELSNSRNTKKIIISCRSGNYNKLLAEKTLSNVVKYQIDDLEPQYIYNFFKAKSNNLKIQQLKLLKKNHSLVNEIKDILLIKLFWDTIEELDNLSSIIDLLRIKIDLLLDNPKHKKHIEELNLLNPKKEEIIELNQDISFEFQDIRKDKFQFRFSQKELQNLILNKFDRLDYNSTNVILNYIADLFFENSHSDNISKEMTYVYQHRRYQEYFFTQRLRKEYEKNPQILRELKIISNTEYFENVFFKYLEKEYKKENNLIGFIELNLINVYLGKTEVWGAEEPYYLNSDEFIPALVNQNDVIFNELIEEDSLQLKNKVSFDFAKFDEYLSLYKLDIKHYVYHDYFEDVWANQISLLIKNITILWKADKKNIANELISQFEKLIDLYNNDELLNKVKEREHLSDPFYEQIENWIYYELIIKRGNSRDFFYNYIRINHNKYKEPNQETFYPTEEHPKSNIIKSFIRVCLKEKNIELFDLLNDFNEYEFICLLDVLKTIDFLPFFIKHTSIHNRIKSFISDYKKQLFEKNDFILFYKKFFDVKLTEEEIFYINSQFTQLYKERKIDVSIRKMHIRFSLLSYAIDKYSFDEINKINRGLINETALFSALLKDYISLLKSETNIEAIIRNYILYVNSNNENNHGINIKEDITYLWASIFTFSLIDVQSLIKLKSILIKEENHINTFNFYSYFESKNSINTRFISENDLIQFENNVTNFGGYISSYVDRCFKLSFLYSKINEKKAKFYFEKGIIEGILRHGWRKDNIVNSLLIDALEILWKNNWETHDKLKEYSKGIFNLTIRVNQITDGKGTWRGVYNLVELVANYDINFAIELKNIFISEHGNYDFSNSLITSIITNKIKLGFSIEEIEEDINEYRKDYDFEGKVRPDFYEQIFVVYLNIAENNLYSDEEREKAFTKALLQIEKIKKQELKYYFRDNDFKSEKLRFKKLCEKYNISFELEFDTNDELKIIPKFTEENFIEQLLNSQTTKQISGKYVIFKNYHNGILLSKYSSWKALINKTFEINGNISLFTEFLKENYFPNSSFWSNNSKYLHLGLAAALENINTRQEMLNYLYENSGHGGFINIMKAFEVLNDKKMCLALFYRYLNFCKFLVN